MNSGKTAQLLMRAHSFMENGIPVLCVKPSIDTRDGDSVIKSRIGLKMECLSIDQDDDIFEITRQYCETMEAMGNPSPRWVLCDESQFLTPMQVDQMARIVDDLGIDVMCYGLRNDFTGHLFDGSRRLFELADNIEEIKLTCKCGRKAVINARIDDFGNVVTNGDQVQIGGNEMYRPMCRKCYLDSINYNTNNVNYN